MIEIFGLFWLLCFNGISTFIGYLMPKLSLKKNSSGTTYPIAWRIRVDTFPMGINMKVNAIARLEFELASNGVTIQHINP